MKPLLLSLCLLVAGCDPCEEGYVPVKHGLFCKRVPEKDWCWLYDFVKDIKGCEVGHKGDYHTVVCPSASKEDEVGLGITVECKEPTP